MSDKDEERIRNLGRGFCWMRPVDYGGVSSLRMHVEVDEQGSTLVMGGLPVLHYDGETVWANTRTWATIVASWTSCSYSRRAQRVREKKSRTVASVMGRCLPLHWRASFLPFELSFKASNLQATVSMPLAIAGIVPVSDTPDSVLRAVELPPDFDLATYHGYCTPPRDVGYAFAVSERAYQYLKSLQWKTCRRRELVRKQVPDCPWDLPPHRNKVRQGGPK